MIADEVFWTGPSQLDGPTYCLGNHRHLRGDAVVEIAIKAAAGNYGMVNNIIYTNPNGLSSRQSRDCWRLGREP